jgi:hypothetical protein
MSSSVEEELTSPIPGQKSLQGMLVGVKGAVRFWLIILQSRIKLGKSYFEKSTQNRVILINYFTTCPHT